MSNTIDQRVVEMRFDNSHFESNVKTSMSTLEKLKQSLNLSNASKGLDGLTAAAKRVDMSGLGTAVDTVRTKFSALEVMGVTALANITNSAVNAGKRIVSALTIQPVTTGFSEYELKMNSVQTIMAGTGEKLETVNKYLEELNEYSDRTIYSFADMTSNIGKFTNAGVKLEDAVTAIKGVSNVAAISGANANEASRAMYNFSQAISSGYVKLIDWKSIELANMGTMAFKEQLLETAVACGTLIREADGMYSSLTTNDKGERSGLFNAAKSFNDELDKQWMTTEVLVETLKKYTDETTELGQKAYASAQDIKTFTQLFDTLKESAQSGWAKTWELLIGDFDEAKITLTELSNTIGPIINGISDFRNNILEGALGNPFEGLAKKIESVTGATETMTSAMKNYEGIVDRVINGEFGNGQERWDKLAKAGFDWAHAQNLVNEKLGDGTRHATDYKEAQNGVSEAHAKSLTQLLEMSDAHLKNAGFTDDEIEALRELQKQSELTGIPLEELVKDLDQLNGRTLLINTFKNAGEGLAKVFGAIKGAWADIFPDTLNEDKMSQSLYNIIAALHKLSTNLVMTDETAGKLERTFKGVFAALDIVTTIAGGGLKFAFEAIKQLLDYLDLDLLDITASIGDAIVKFRDWVDSALDFTKVFDAVIPQLKTVADAIKDWVSGLKETDNIPKYIVEGLVKGLIEGVKLVGEAAVALGRAILDGIKNLLGIHSPSTEMEEVGKNVVDGLILGIKGGLTKLWEIIKGIGTKIVELIKQIDFGKAFAVGLSGGILFTGIKALDIISSFTAPLDGLGDLFEGIGSAFEGLGDAFEGIGFKKKTEGIRNIAISIGILAIAVSALAKIETGDLVKAGVAITILGGVLLGLSKLAEIINTVPNIGAQSLSVVGIAGAMFLAAMALKKLGDIDLTDVPKILITLGGIVASFAGIIATFGHFVGPSTTANIDKLGAMLLKLSIAMGIMVGVIKLISMLEWEEMGKGAIGMAGFAIFVGALVQATKNAGPATSKIGSTLIGISIAMGLMVGVIKLISTMEWNELAKGAVGMGAFVIFVGALTQVTKKAGPNTSKLGTTLLGVSASMLILVGVIKLISMMEWEELAKGATGVVVLGAFIAGFVNAVKKGGPDMPKLAGTLLALSVAIGILAAIAVTLSLIDLKGLAKGITAVGLLSLMMSTMLESARGVQSITGTIVAMAVAIGVMATAIAALSVIDPQSLGNATVALGGLIGVFALLVMAAGSLNGVTGMTGKLVPLVGAVAVIAIILGALAALDVEPSIQTATSIGILLAAMSASLVILSYSGKTASTSVGAMAMMAVVVGELAIVLGLMDGLNVEGSISTAVSLGVLLNAMASALLILSYAGKASMSSVGAMATLALVVGELAIILGLMDKLDVEGSISTAVSLGVLLNSMATALAILNFVGPTAGSGVAAMALMGLVVAELAIVLGVMDKLNIEPSIETVASLSVLLLSMSGALVILTAAGAMGPAAFVGIGALATLITGIGGLITGIGALVTEFPKLEEFLNTGIPIIEKIGNALGSFFGNIVGGFIGSAVTSSLPTMATDLSEFMTNLQPFTDSVSSIDDSVVSGVKSLTQALMSITGANLLESITSWATGGSSVEAFAEQLPILAEGLSSFNEKLGEFTPQQVMSVTCAGQAIKALATAADTIPNEGGWLAAIVGDNNMALWSSQLPMVGSGLSQFVAKLTENGTFDASTVTTINSACSAIKALATAADTIPNEGGWLAAIVGDNNMALWSSQLPQVGSGLSQFVAKLTENGTFDASTVTTINSACSAIKSLATAASSIPNEGGWLAAIVGDNSIGAWSTQLPQVGSGLSQFVAKLTENGTFDAATVATVKCAGDAIKALATAADTIPNEGGWLSALLGDNDLATWSTTLPNVGSSLSTFVSNLTANGTFDAATVATVKCAGDAILALANAGSNIDGQADWAKKLFGDNSLSAFSSQFADLGTNLSSFVSNLGTFSSEQVNTVKSAVSAINSFSNLANADLKGAKKNLDGFGEELVDIASDISSFCSDMPETSSIDSAIEGIQKILDMLEDFSGADASVLSKFTKSLKDVGKEGVKAFVEAFTSSSAKSDVKKAGEELINQVVKGVEGKKTDLKEKFSKIASEGVSGVTDQYQSFYDAGSYLVEGFAAGISANSYKAVAQASAMAKAAADAAKKALDINSPSKVFKKIGSSIPEGFALGIESFGGSVKASSVAMTEAAVSGVTDSISRISDVINSDIDAQPTIRPVLDLSNVRAGAGAINGLFGSGVSVGVLSKVGAINTLMNRNSQNGSNLEVVSAINRLRKDLGNVGGDTYMINGVSYSDDSGIADAMKTITRVAIRERRT